MWIIDFILDNGPQLMQLALLVALVTCAWNHNVKGSVMAGIGFGVAFFLGW